MKVRNDKIKKTGGKLKTALVAATALMLLTGCQTLNRLDRVGQPPELAPITNPKAAANYRPVSLPMPAPNTAQSASNSIWRTGARAFFKDQRASEVGDILTINISIQDNATLNNSSARSRGNTENVALPNLFGLENEYAKVLPEGVVPNNLVNLNRNNNIQGSGQIVRNEKIELRVAALVSQVLPNGNLVVHGRQEVRVNHEVRELQVSGVIRPEDISATNEINFHEVAEARIGYGGRGFISDYQGVPYGMELFDIIMPF